MKNGVTDETRYSVENEKVYLSAIKVLYRNDIVTNHLSGNNANPMVLETFRKAFDRHKDVTGLIVHSDQGSHHMSNDYHNMLPKIYARISISRVGNCYDNAS
ncbi:DDE-type integrase/transposase/recombinase [Paenibacillus sp. FSL M7-0420]|uniref:DDE-type integrase/transposase/recombinase n=1 Tax=Paenibacillus sp. FSL M7-0420 TaxID=2921609 RepID=UPI0040407BC6